MANQAISDDKKMKNMEIDEQLEEIRRKKLEELMKKQNLKEDFYQAKPVILSSSNFSETIKKYPLIIVDFYTDWCMPCKFIAPIIEEIAKKYAGKIAVGKLNIDENRFTASRFSVRAVPTLIVFKNGTEIDRIIGAYPNLEERLKKYL